MSIKTKLMLLFITFTLISLALFGALVFSRSGDILKSVRMAQLNSMADLKKDKIETFFNERLGDLRSIEGMHILSRNLPLLSVLRNKRNAPAQARARAEVDERMKPFREAYAYLDVMLVNSRGTVVYELGHGNSNNHLNKQLEDGKAFSEGRKGPFFTDIFFDAERDGRPVMWGIAPINDGKGSFIGEIVLEIDMEPIYQFIQDNTGIGTTGEALIVRRESDVVLFMSPLRSIPNSALRTTVAFDAKMGLAAQKAANGETGSGFAKDYKGTDVLAAWRYLPSLRWGLVTKIDTVEAFEPVRQLEYVIVVVGALLIFVGALAAAALAGSLARPIQALQRGTEIIGSGNLDYKVGTRAKDEVGHLSRLIDSMSANLKKITASRDDLDKEVAERRRAEEALRQASLYHRSLLEASLDPLVTIAVDGKITDVNVATEKVTGLARAELINTDFSDYFTDPEKARAGYRLVFSEGSVKDYSLELRHKSGHLTPVLYNAAVYRDEAGNAIGVFAAARDITERKRAEELAKLDEARTASILRISQYPAASLRELLDFALDEAIALSGSKFGYLYFYHEDTQDFVLHAWSKDVMAECTIANPQTDYQLEKTGIWGEVVRQRKPIILNDFSAPHPLKKGYPEGHAPLLRFFSVPVFSEGRIVAVTGFANRPADYTDRDVSQMTLLMDSVWKIVERKKAEEKLKLANAYNRSLLEASLDPLVTIDAGGKITDVNLATEKVTGRSRAELIGTDFSDYFVEPMKAKAGYQLVFEEGFVMDYALEIRSRDGHVTPVLYNAAVYNDDRGNVIGVFAAARDVTERKKAEEEIRTLNRELEARVIERTAQLENTNRELEAFSYSVSHDLRSPLRSIEGFSLALLEDYSDNLDDMGKSYLNRVRNATMRMGHLIDDLLKLSRVSRSEMNREKVDLSVIGKDIAGRLSQSDPERSAKFVIADGLVAYGDAPLLAVALENLFSNAWKFSENVAPTVIEFGVTRKENADIFYVKDNGVGFDMAYAGKLFSPFQRLHSVEDFTGTGIGLATVKRIINRHGGQVWIESEVNKGTTVYFTLG